MDPIQPIEPRSPWISELAPAQAQRDRSETVQRERRKASAGGERKPGPRRKPPGEERGQERGPDEDGPEGRHIDVRA